MTDLPHRQLRPTHHDPACVFCRIIAGDEERTDVFWEDDVAVGLMDIRPLKAGHALLIPRDHHPTVKELPAELVGSFFTRAAALNRAVEIAFDADGSFNAWNTHVSQSVHHFHVHVVPRTFGDKLFSGGRWKRIPDKDTCQRAQRRDALGDAMNALMAERS